MEYSEYTPENIFSGNVMPVVVNELTLAANQAAKKLSVIYYDPSKGFYTTAAEGETLDSSKAYALSTSDVEAQTAAVTIPAYFTGEFNKSAVALADGQNMEDYVIAFRSKGIFLK